MAARCIIIRQKEPNNLETALDQVDSFLSRRCFIRKDEGETLATEILSQVSRAPPLNPRNEIHRHTLDS